MKNSLENAIEYEKKEEKKIRAEDRPMFHLTPRVGWMNDPNGFSYYNGKYHMFYQYYPYDTQWGPMHWGHGVSTDLLTWEYLPAALAPENDYDHVGCFSGSAIDLPDGRQLLLYTGVRQEQIEGKKRDIQTQCVAIGDGERYRKYEQNPIMTEDVLPEGSSRYDFRDPKIWREDGKYYCIVGNCTEDKDGQILLFSSEDAIQWKFEKILIKNNQRFGKMWECPDFFELDGKQILITSPQDMLPVGLEFYNGNGTLYISGNCDKDYNFEEETYGTLDHGMDFYAPQTILTEDGRRIMIGWMQNWDTLSFKPELPWFGQMSIPREVNLRNGKIIQKPIKELENLYEKKVAYHDIVFAENLNLPGIEGRCIDLELEISPVDEDRMYEKFEVHLADNGRYFSSVSYDPYDSVIKIDRKYSGTRRESVHQRKCYVAKKKGKLKVRIILDRFSVEVFVNDGEQVLSMTIYTDITATGINFLADGEVRLDAVMHEIRV